MTGVALDNYLIKAKTVFGWICIC